MVFVHKEKHQAVLKKFREMGRSDVDKSKKVEEPASGEADESMEDAVTVTPDVPAQAPPVAAAAPVADAGAAPVIDEECPVGPPSEPEPEPEPEPKLEPEPKPKKPKAKKEGKAKKAEEPKAEGKPQKIDRKALFERAKAAGVPCKGKTADLLVAVEAAEAAVAERELGAEEGDPLKGAKPIEEGE